MTRRAQVQQVFVYLSAILVIGFVVLFGYRMVDKILDQQCEVSEHSFMGSLEDAIDRNVHAQSVTDVAVPAPCKYQQLCFVDARVVEGSSTFNNIDNSLKATNAVMWGNAMDDIEWNVYLLIPGKETKPIMFDDRITTTEKPIGTAEKAHLCINASLGEFVFWVKGKGDGVYLYADER
ncbi:hypothetical protein GF367_02885 [Candidatus Woesearchaeota archaeon]|nr:hypothetical protein [Candidatus Woesearchaeota archaeon]